MTEPWTLWKTSLVFSDRTLFISGIDWFEQPGTPKSATVSYRHIGSVEVPQGVYDMPTVRIRMGSGHAYSLVIDPLAANSEEELSRLRETGFRTASDIAEKLRSAMERCT